MIHGLIMVDIEGVINKLDYIKDLHAITIWITPPMDNRDTAFKADFGGGRSSRYVRIPRLLV